MHRALVFAALVGTVSACNGGPADDPDCQHLDLGSCGVACCKLLFKFDAACPEDVKNNLMTAMSKGGPDGRFALQTTAEGTFGFTEDINVRGPHYVGQAYHTTPFPVTHPNVTSGPYRDTVNFLVFTDAASNATMVRAFSISEINGALGDNGMNYKNILQVMRSDVMGGWHMTQEDSSCPPPQP